MKTRDYSTFNRTLFGLGKGDIDYLDITQDKDDLAIFIKNQSIPISNVIQFLKTQNLSSVVLRVPQLIEKQLDKLYHAFSSAFTKYNYPSLYQGVFPVKVNHNAPVLRAISNYGKKFGHGWEVGTKPELLIALSFIRDPKTVLIICNGSKDSDYIESTLNLTQLGYNIIITIESKRELSILSSLSRKLKIKPQIGLRLKMNQNVEGHWGHSSGLYSKFGLSATDLSEIISELKKTDLLQNLKLIHAHLGSQINKTHYFEQAVVELMGYYIWLYDSGANGLRTIDLGGGLSIDYEGNNIASESGVNYSFRSYAETIVSTVYKSLNNRPEIIPPDIITESGRAITATSSMLLVEILERRDVLPPPNKEFSFAIHSIKSMSENISQLIENSNITSDLEQVINSFSEEIKAFQGDISFWTNLENQTELEQLISNVYSQIIIKTKCLIKNKANLNGEQFRKSHPRLFDLMTHYTVDLVGNFSLFRGICDVALAGQYFPIIPTIGLSSKIETLTRLVDITCDSDGEVTKFITHPFISGTSFNDYFTVDGHLLSFYKEKIILQGIPLPSENLQKGKYILIGLTGAYQDTVQFDQNLLGGLPEIEIKVEPSQVTITLIDLAEVNENLIKKSKFNVENDLSNVPKILLDQLLHTNPYVKVAPDMKIMSGEHSKLEENNRESKQKNQESY